MERRNLHKDKMTGWQDLPVMEQVPWQEKTMEFQSKWRMIVHFLCPSTAWLTGLRFAEVKRLMVFLIWQKLQCKRDPNCSVPLFWQVCHLWSQSLEEFQKIFEHPKLKIKEVINIRWFSFYSALEILYCTWQSLVAVMTVMIKPVDSKRAWRSSILLPPSAWWCMGFLFSHSWALLCKRNM